MRVLDICCGAGGASAGYVEAGFEVVGWDLEPHPTYPWEFHLGDGLEVLADVDYVQTFDLVHMSWPCQKFSTATADRDRHPDLITPGRELALRTGVPYIMENVPQAPLINPVRLCGSSFGLKVRRHRAFESSLPLAGSACDHAAQGQPVGVYGDHFDTREYFRPDGTRRGGKATSMEEAYDAMGGLRWMSWMDLKEAIPSQYTAFLGRQACDLMVLI